MEAFVLRRVLWFGLSTGRWSDRAENDGRLSKADHSRVASMMAPQQEEAAYTGCPRYLRHLKYMQQCQTEYIINYVVNDGWR